VGIVVEMDTNLLSHHESLQISDFACPSHLARTNEERASASTPIPSPEVAIIPIPRFARQISHPTHATTDRFNQLQYVRFAVKTDYGRSSQYGAAQCNGSARLRLRL
jgi:hypothetical protein